MDRVAVGHGVAQEAGAEGSRAFGPLAPDWDSWTTPKGLTRQWAGGTSSCLEQAEHWLHGDEQIHPKGKSWLSKPLQKTWWSSQMQWICEVNKHLKRKALGNPSKVLHAKHGISGEPCEAGWLKTQSLWDRVPVSREAKLCRDLQVSGTLTELAREVCTAPYSG